MGKITYESAGVNKESGYQEVQLIKKFIDKTYTEGVLSHIGGFSGLYELDKQAYESPVLVSGTDGVGTKVKIAQLMDVHDSVGIDCVAMCVNDILCQGAKPLFFLDYIATGKLIPEKMAKIVEGVAQGCIQAKAALIGGETAEMPGIYNADDYDIAGFCVGIVEKSKIIDGKNIKEGDVLLALPSSGVHSNGFSLIRKIIFDIQNLTLDTYVEELNMTLGEALLVPTSIYADTVLKVLQHVDVHGIAHITGGGVHENLPRLLHEDLDFVIHTLSIPCPPIFNVLVKWGNITKEEMYATFNMGIGMVLVVSKEDADMLMTLLNESQKMVYKIGEVVKGNRLVHLVEERYE